MTSPPPDPLDGFDEFWTAYPRRNGKRLYRGKAEDQWRKLTPPQRAAAIVGAGHYATSGQIPQDAFRWLRDRAFTDWQTPAVPDVPTRPASARDARLAELVAEGWPTAPELGAGP